MVVAEEKGSLVVFDLMFWSQFQLDHLGAGQKKKQEGLKIETAGLDFRECVFGSVPEIRLSSRDRELDSDASTRNTNVRHQQSFHCNKVQMR